MFRSVSVAPQYSKKLARKFFWAKYSEMGVFKRHTISYEKRFKLFFTKIKTKAILEIGLCTSHFSVATEKLSRRHHSFIEAYQHFLNGSVD